MPEPLKLQVLICTYGSDGLQRLLQSIHPRVEGVGYLVAWQNPETSGPMPEKLRRDDFEIVTSATRGLSRNRNIALAAARGEILLIADDDVSYTPAQLCSVIEAFGSYPEEDILTFRYVSENAPKRYPDHTFPLDHPAKGYYPTSFEIAIRRSSLPPDLRFDENFGIGALFPCGEEDLFLLEARRRGLRERFLPITICRHDGDTTAARILHSEGFVMTRGAVVPQLYPLTWPLRMLLLACRESDPSVGMGRMRYIRTWLKGLRKCRQIKKRK